MRNRSNGRLHKIYKFFVTIYCMDMTNIWKNKDNDQENTKDIEDSLEQPVGEPEPDQEPDLVEEDTTVIEEDLVIDDVDTEFEEVDPGIDDPDDSIANDTVQEVLDSKTELEVTEVAEVDIEIVGEAPLGRPTKMDPDTRKKLNTALQIGLSQKKAAIYAGIGETTFYRWQKKAVDIDQECQGDPDNIKDVADLELWEFWESIKKAKVDGEINHLGNITNAANNGVWQASAWFLERSNPNDWSRREKDDETTGKKEPIIVKIEFD